MRLGVLGEGGECILHVNYCGQRVGVETVFYSPTCSYNMTLTLLPLRMLVMFPPLESGVGVPCK